MSDQFNLLPFNSEQYAKPCIIEHTSVLHKLPEGNILVATLNEKALPKENIPFLITKTLEDNEHRKRLRRKLRDNAPYKYPLVGKPSSAFVLIDKEGKSRLHYLVETTTNPRPDKLHDTMRYADETPHLYQSENLLGLQTLWSGHLADITPEYGNNDYKHIILMDKFIGPQPKLNNFDKRIILSLQKNRILPISNDGFILKVHNQTQ